MARLLFEIGCEELPASACREAVAQLPELCRRQLGAEPSRMFVGPRRLAFVVDELPERSPDEERRGPTERIAFDEEGRPTKAAEGFARGAGVSLDALERRDGHVWARIPGEPIAATLEDRLREIPRNLGFSKSMVWEAGGMRFARPVRWLCARLEAQAVGQLGTSSYGHRFTGGKVEIPDAGVYAQTLRAAGVEPDAAERRRLIVEALDAIGGWSDPAGVMEEVVHLVETPLVLEGRFDQRFLQLPERVVVTAMQSHQRYLPLGENRFAIVANGGEPNVVRAGNENVLETRLEDASFTFERDVELGLEGLAQRLGAITFFEGAGTFADKTKRLVKLVERLGGGEASLEAARLAKADQAAELVREFPDLEGHIGAEYARLAGYPEAVCAAIDEQYLPDSAAGPLPSTEPGLVLAAADKIDNLRVSFGLGHRPSGSRDPFGLRRGAIGICRLALEGGLTIERALLGEEVRDFVEERLEGMLELPVEFVRAARASAAVDLAGVARLARALYEARESPEFDAAYTAYDRAHRLAGRAEKEAAAKVDGSLLLEPAERELAQLLAQTSVEVDGDVQGALAAAASLAPAVERFFTDVLVMDDDRQVRANRLRLLLDLRDTLGALGDFSQIPR